MKRGDIYFATLDPTQGSEIRKTRPVVIVSNDAANRASALVTVVPLTSTLVKVQPFEVKLTAAETGLSKDGKALAQQVRTIDKNRLGSLRRGIVPAVKLRALDDALRLHLAL
ncbi:MAG: type II toxin-antitoxin system PemK/MazF family toxin [Burkholderiales bacterium]